MNRYSFRCFGKLPIHSDFIRHQASGTEIRSLDQWFQDGIYSAKLRLGQDWSQSFSNSATWNFLFHSRLSDSFLVGVAMPSSDKGGRVYPFFLFLRVDKGDFCAPLSFVPLSFSRFFNLAQGIAKTGWLGTDLKQFLTFLQGVSIPFHKDVKSVKNDYMALLENKTNEAFWADLFGDFNDPRKYQLDRNLGEILQPMRSFPSSKFRLGLRFPVFSRESLESGAEGIDIPYWFDWVFHALTKEDDPVFFWNRETEKESPSMLAFFSAPSPKQFLSLIQPELEHDAWFNLVQNNSLGPGKKIDTISDDRKASLDDKGISMSDFLDFIKR